MVSNQLIGAINPIYKPIVLSLYGTKMCNKGTRGARRVSDMKELALREENSPRCKSLVIVCAT